MQKISMDTTRRQEAKVININSFRTDNGLLHDIEEKELLECFSELNDIENLLDTYFGGKDEDCR